jgi:hypothetical protein
MGDFGLAPDFGAPAVYIGFFGEGQRGVRPVQHNKPSRSSRPRQCVSLLTQGYLRVMCNPPIAAYFCAPRE